MTGMLLGSASRALLYAAPARCWWYGQQFRPPSWVRPGRLLTEVFHG